MDNLAVCPTCFGTDPECKNCLGVGVFNTDDAIYDSDCCGFRIFMLDVGDIIFLAVDDLDRISGAEYNEYTLCEALYHDYC